MEDNFVGVNETEVSLQEEQLRKPSLAQVAVVFSITVVLFFTIGSMVQKNEIYSGLLITEFLLIMAPSLLLLFIYRYDVKKILRLNKVSLLSIVLIFFIMLFAIPVVGIFNFANMWIVTKLFGRVDIVQPPVAETIGGLLINILVIGGSAGICEEIMFRGVIQRGLERFGAVKSILLTSFLFAIMHFDFQKLFGVFLLGALIGFIVYKTNSIFSGMFAHFANNTIAVLAGFAATQLDKGLEAELGEINNLYNTGIDFSAFENLPSEMLIVVIVSVIFMVLFCSAMLAGLIIALSRINNGKAEKIIPERGKSLAGALWFIPAVVIIGFVYFMQGKELLNGNADVAANVLKFLAQPFLLLLL